MAICSAYIKKETAIAGGFFELIYLFPVEIKSHYDNKN